MYIERSHIIKFVGVPEIVKESHERRRKETSRAGRATDEARARRGRCMSPITGKGLWIELDGRGDHRD